MKKILVVKGSIVDIAHACEENIKEEYYSILKKSYELGYRLARGHA